MKSPLQLSYTDVFYIEKSSLGYLETLPGQAEVLISPAEVLISPQRQDRK